MRIPLFRQLAVLLFALSLTGCGLNKASSQIAFMGDSITQGWHFPRVNYGVHGNTTAQMLARFPHQVLGHSYRTVYILGGTNDILLGLSPDSTISNLDAMAHLAASHGITPILGEIPPMFIDNGIHQASVQELNRRIVALARERNLKLVDYYDALAGHTYFESDGIHMRRLGYVAMESALVRASNPF
jgi:lysophospholipase L1-like esterase